MCFSVILRQARMNWISIPKPARKEPLFYIPVLLMFFDSVYVKEKQ